MDIAVIGAGPAGLTAAHRLQQAGHRVTVFEREATAGGRTHTEHHGQGHWVDTGAGWLASFYPEALALLSELELRSLLSPMQLRGGGELMLDGAIVPTPNSVGRIVRSELLGPVDKLRFFAWMARLFATQKGKLHVDVRHDAETALQALSGAGETARERVIRPNFEGPFFARLEQMSGTLVRSWMRCLSVGTFFHVDGGMDAPWRRLGERVGVRTGVDVQRVQRHGGGVRVSLVASDGAPAVEQFDAVVVAVPAPRACQIVDPGERPAWLDQVQYVPHVRLYAARRGDGGERRGVHVFPNTTVATVERGNGRFGAWGAVPDDWEWGLVCAPASGSAPLLELSDDDAIARLWGDARQIDPGLFDIADAEIVQLVRWQHAVPDVGPGYYGRMAAWQQQPPIVFAGDWLVQPCVEGAVRSGNQAARCFPGAAGAS